jgi:hypothetical protein
MTVHRCRLLLLLFFMTLSVITVASLMRSMKRTDGFFVPSARETKAAQAMFASAMVNGNQKGISEKSLGLGLVAARLSEPGVAGFALSEPVDDCQGRGVYLFRTMAKTVPVAITAPHRGADRHTGTIARLLFTEYPIAAAAWNSAPRNPNELCPFGGDIAHEPTHYLTAFSRAFAKQYPAGRVVQLHGFDGIGRDHMVARGADFIISDGSNRPSPRLLDLADCLTVAFPERRVAVYPIDTKELGATTNSQGKALRDAGFTGFAHIEMAADLRNSLAMDAAQRALLSRCLGVGLP